MKQLWTLTSSLKPFDDNKKQISEFQQDENDNSSNNNA